MKTVAVSLDHQGYPIHIGTGARRLIDTLLRKHPEIQRVLLVADERVAELHGPTLIEALPTPPELFRVASGEASKSLDTAATLYDSLARARLERSDLIVTFGGGVVGDLGGFVAATWLRGIRFVQVPTTLLAAVDASVGGKTGVNHAAGKNLIGAFHQPLAVIIDTDFLATLPARDFVAGLAESVKHALIRDAGFLAWHEAHADALAAREPAVLADLIARNCEIKAAVVAQDEREQNLRAILNFGHTIGHALEHVLGYELRHGECVALGMLAANQLACTRGRLGPATADRALALIGRLGLPTRLPKPVDPQRVLAACHMDKKVRGGRINFILITAPGETLRVSDVSDDEIVAAVTALQPR